MSLNRNAHQKIVSLIVVVLTILISHNARGQARTGIYIISNTEIERCDNKFKLLNDDGLYCLLEEPILEPDAFESIGAISFDSVFNMRQFKIRLTPMGAKQVNTIAQKLPDHKLGVVVDGILISAINLAGIYHARTVVIWDEFDSHAMEWIHKSLKNQVNKGAKKI